MASVNEKLFDEAVSHQIGLQRYSNGIVRRMIALLNRVDPDLMAQLMAKLETAPDSLSVERIDGLLKSVNELNAQAYAKVNGQLDEELKGLTEYEVGYQHKLFEHALPAVVKVQPVQPLQVYAAAMARPFQGKLLSEFMDGLEAGKAEAIRNAVRMGFVEGQTVNEIVKRIRGTKALNYADGLLETNRRGVEAIVRTAINHTGNYARQAFFEANSDIVSEERYTATLDARTTELCASRDGNTYPIGKGPAIPAHVNCLLGDTNISTCSPVSNVYKRAYKGIVVNIVTKSNRSISVTPNHPILTREGWKAAGQLNSFDELVCIDNPSVFGNDYKHSVEAKIGDIFSFLYVSSDPSFVCVRPASAEDFHGDVTDPEVSVVSVNGLIWDDVVKAFAKNIKKDWLIFRALINFSFTGFCSFYKFIMACHSSANRLMGFFCKICYFLWASFSHSCELLLRPIAKFWVNGFKVINYWSVATSKIKEFVNSISSNAAFISINNRFFGFIRKFKVSQVFNFNTACNEKPLNGFVTNAIHIGDLVNANFVNGAKFDNVVSVVFREVDTHVYNLENKDNWYTSNGIVTHNCRSLYVPVLKSWREMGIPVDEAPESTRASIDGQVPESTTYQSWLQKQSVERQNEVLGVTKAQLFRDGGLTLDRFVSNAGHVYTLDELRQRDAQAFEKAGL